MMFLEGFMLRPVVCFFVLLSITAFAGAASTHPTTSPAITMLRQRLIASVLPPNPEHQKTLHAAARRIASALTPDGTWPDINYQDQIRSRWPTGEHMQRILLMSKSHNLSPDPALKSKIDLALDHWLARDYQNPNWWWNEIGVPQLTAESLILLWPDITEKQLAKAIEILHRSDWKKWTGQNLVWGVSVQIMRGVLTHDEQTIADAYSRLYDEIRLSFEEGIQPDYSFHQHGRQLYNGGYGLSFASDVGRYVAVSWNTPWQIPDEKLAIFTRYLLDGQSWMIYDNLFDYSAVGREIVRPGKAAVPKMWNAAGPIAPAGAAYSLINSVRMLTDLATIPRRHELETLEERLSQQPNARPRIGNKHFWRSDYMTHRRSTWFVSVKMLSERILNAELVNDEGKLSHHLSEGATFIYRTGDEYRDIFPVWDWRKIPGTTAAQFDLKTDRNEIRFFGQTSFVGGASDGAYGLAFMDVKRRELTGHKAWFFFDSEMIALGAGITSSADAAVITTINQSLLRGRISRNTIAHEHYRWLHHDGIGYLFPTPTPTRAPATNVSPAALPRDTRSAHDPRITLTTDVQSGNWIGIAPNPDRAVSLRVFNLTLDHGPKPGNATYSYVVLPNAATDDCARWAQHPPVEILANTPDCQAVRHKPNNILMAAFPKPGRIASTAGSVEVDQPCLLILREGSLTVSNPENKPLTVQVKIDGRPHTVMLPGGPTAGSSVTIAVALPDQR